MLAGTQAAASRRWERAWRLVLVLVPIAVFAPTLGHGFVTWDDPLYVLDSVDVRSPRWLSLDLWLSPGPGYPVPLTTLSFALDHAVHGFSPLGYHLVNVLLHALNVLLVARLAERVGVARPWSRVGALLFAVHPLVVEPVAWVTGRKDLLATAFALGALDSWLRARASRRRQVVGLVLFACAALCKPSVWAIPLVLLALGRGRRPSLAVLAPAIALVLLLGTATFALIPGRVLDPEVDTAFPLAAYLERLGAVPLRALRELGYRLSLLVRLRDLRPLYILPDPRWLEPATLGGIAAAAGLLAASALRRVRRSRAWPLLLLLLASLLPPILNSMHGSHEIGDSHLYLTLAAVAGLVGLGLERLAPRLRPAVRLAAPAALVLALVPFSLAQSSIWRDSVRFWTFLFATYPGQPLACKNLGIAHAEAGRPGLALDLYGGCARAHHDRRFYLHDMVVAARRAGDPRFEALLAELLVELPDDDIARQARERARERQRAGAGDGADPPATAPPSLRPGPGAPARRW